ncbi:MAG TPA: DUF938 domain-containing protein [Hyphomicrobiaceae bacterium]|nr:DUF938 domain-containing protein [Hyphomicrobiaceae bacterium]
MEDNVRLVAPSVARNREPIFDVLSQHLPGQGCVLEIASGSGEHVAFFGEASDPGLVFQPSDPDASARASIDAWVKARGVRNVRPAILLDAASDAWPDQMFDAVICINMIHISPFAATRGLIQGAARVLRPGGKLFLYGPFQRRGLPTAPSNMRFDEDLRRRNPEWGLRVLEEVADLAVGAGFSLSVIEEMPANNLAVVFGR